jgi:hypothetical protein
MHTRSPLVVSARRFRQIWTSARSCAPRFYVGAMAAAWLLQIMMLFVPASRASAAQEQQQPTIEQSQSRPVPNLIRFGASLPSHAGERVEVRFSVYRTQTAAVPLWREEQRVETDSEGQFTVVLGAGSAAGVPRGTLCFR